MGDTKVIIIGGGMAEHDLEKDLSNFLVSGGWKGTKTIHDHLKEKGYKISRRKLLNLLHFYAEPGNYVSIGGIRQKSWIM